MTQHRQLDLTHTHILPALTGLHQGGKHQLQAALLILETRDRFGAPPLFLESPLNQARCPNALEVQRRTAQEAEAGFQIVL